MPTPSSLPPSPESTFRIVGERNLNRHNEEGTRNRQDNGENSKVTPRRKGCCRIFDANRCATVDSRRDDCRNGETRGGRNTGSLKWWSSPPPSPSPSPPMELIEVNGWKWTRRRENRSGQDRTYEEETCVCFFFVCSSCFFEKVFVDRFFVVSGHMALVAITCMMLYHSMYLLRAC